MVRNSILVLTFFAGMIVSCRQSDNKAVQNRAAIQGSIVNDPATFTTMQWIDSAVDKGTINEGDKVEIIYHFKNTGQKPLVIKSVQPSCGCTVAEKPGEPIAPGKEGLIRAEFDSRHKQGQTHKTIMVTANTQQQSYKLVFDVNINKKVSS